MMNGYFAAPTSGLIESRAKEPIADPALLGIEATRRAVRVGYQ